MRKNKKKFAYSFDNFPILVLYKPQLFKLNYLFYPVIFLLNSIWFEKPIKIR
jgi:hypothetical protein